MYITNWWTKKRADRLTPSRKWRNYKSIFVQSPLCTYSCHTVLSHRDTQCATVPRHGGVVAKSYHCIFIICRNSSYSRRHSWHYSNWTPKTHKTTSSSLRGRRSDKREETREAPLTADQETVRRYPSRPISESSFDFKYRRIYLTWDARHSRERRIINKWLKRRTLYILYSLLSDGCCAVCCGSLAQ